MRYASSKKIYTVTSTNGHYLTPRKAEETVSSGLSRIIISLDGATQESYEKYRVHGQLEKVIEGTVSEMSNKFYTIYTSDDVILKMTKDPSGFMQGTLILTIDDKSSKDDLKCQLVYNI